MRPPITLGGSSISPGESRTIALALPELYSQTDVHLSVHVRHGRRPGPILFLSSTIHGDELNGIEVIRRVLGQRSMRRLRGTLIAAPIVNVYGFLAKSRYLPDRRDLNRSFPGSEKGTIASRVAHTFMTEVVDRCTHGIDLHTGAIGRENLPQIRAEVLKSPETMAMARAFEPPVILDSALRDDSLRDAVAGRGVPVLLYEGGEALRFDEVAIRAGVRGVLGVMRHLDMLPGSRPRKRPYEPRVAKSSSWVRASESGILRATSGLGDLVQKGEVLGYIAGPLGEHEVEVRATWPGVIVGRTNVPLVHEGEALFHIARFDQPDSAASSVEAFQDAHDPLLDEDPGGEPVIV